MFPASVTSPFYPVYSRRPVTHCVVNIYLKLDLWYNCVKLSDAIPHIECPRRSRYSMPIWTLIPPRLPPPTYI